MNPKQERFVAEYLVDQNATQAATRAGYSAKTAYAQGCALLKVPEVRKAVNAGKRRMAAKLELTAEKVLADIDRIARKAELAKDFGPAIRGRHLLGMHLKLFTEKHEHGGIGGKPIQMSVTAADEAL